MVKILHAADFHLDSAFRALDADRARQRRKEARDSLMRLAHFANAENVDLVLLSGDLFDSGEIYRETVEMLAESFGKIKGKVFIAPGNHDPWDLKGPYGTVDWPENVFIFKEKKICGIELPELNCVVHGAAFTERECDEGLFQKFHAPQDDRIHLMVLHGNVDGRHKYAPLSRGEIAESGLDYLAMGHVHQFSGIQKLWSTTWAYPGCPEGRGFDECGKHGVILGTVDKGMCDLKFVTFGLRKYEILRVDVTGKDPLKAVEEMLREEATGADIYRIVFVGEIGEKGLDLQRVEEVLRERFYQLELRDETHLAEDLWRRAQENSLRGLFLKELLRQRAAAKTEEERAKIDRAARIGLAALDKRDI